MDNIQRKLALIDRELASGGDLHKKIVSTSPLIFIATGLIAGILIQDILAWSIQLWLILLVFCAVGTVILLVSLKAAYQPYITAYIALVCFLCLGAIRLSSFYQPKSNDIRKFVANERKLATIRGLIITEPYINDYGFIVDSNQPIDVNEIIKPEDYEYEYKKWKFAKFMPTDPTTSFYLKLKEVQTVAGWEKAHGTIRVQVGEPVLDLKAGDYIQAYCWLDRFKKATNPGQFDIAGYLARRSVFIAASVKSRDSITLVEKHHPSHFTRLKGKLREITSQALLGDTLPNSPSQGLLQALLLGYRQNIDNATYEAFRKTGLLHFISLSGLHVGILVWIIWQLCKTVGLMRRTQAIVCIIAIGTLLLIVPPRAPIVRAAIICFVFCLALFFRRHSNPLNSLSLAAIILLLIRPTQVFEAGWQLSFTAVLGILVFTRNFENFLHERTGNWFWISRSEEVPFTTRLIKKSGVKVIALFSVSLAAWIGSAGIILYHFYRISPFASVWTVVAFLPVAAILPIGYLKIILSFLLPTVAMLLGIIVNLLSDLLIWIVERIASWHIGSWNISQILIGHVPLAPIILYYCLILFAAFVYFRRPLLKKAICFVMALTIIIFLGVTKWQRTYRDDLILTCLDVGHGQAILAQLPGKVNVLFDAGSMHKSNIGNRIVGPFLDYSGINKIEAIIISHNDIDHINGIPEIVEHCDVNGVYANDAFLTAVEKDPCDTAAFLDNVLRKKEKDFEINNIKNLNLNSAAKIKIIWPDGQICLNEELSDNDSSVVSLIEFAGRKILLCSDIEQFAQKELIRLFPNLKVDILVVPHHGLTSSLEPGFLENLDADIFICSCSRRQYERTIPALGMGTSKFNKIKSFYTTKDGAITVCINKYGTIKASTFIKNRQ